jgi:hypothetical protein
MKNLFFPPFFFACSLFGCRYFACWLAAKHQSLTERDARRFLSLFDALPPLSRSLDDSKCAPLSFLLVAHTVNTQA